MISAYPARRFVLPPWSLPSLSPRSGKGGPTIAGAARGASVWPACGVARAMGRLALQLPFCFEVGSLSGSLVSSAPE
jgi:hypothetical protein